MQRYCQMILPYTTRNVHPERKLLHSYVLQLFPKSESFQDRIKLPFNPNDLQEEKLKKIMKKLNIPPKLMNECRTQEISRKIQFLRSKGCSERAICLKSHCRDIVMLCKESEIVYRSKIIEKYGIGDLDLTLLYIAGKKPGKLLFDIYRQMELAGYSSRIIKTRVDFLMLKGFTTRDVFNSIGILKQSVNSFRKAYEEIQDSGIDQITLSTLHSYIMSRKLLSKKVHLFQMAKWFHWDIHDMQISTENFNGLVLQEWIIIDTNYIFLKSRGFSDKSLQRLPMILGHDHAILKRTWKKLKKDQCNICKSVKSLNLLQYMIEKGNNFRSTIVYFED